MATSPISCQSPMLARCPYARVSRDLVLRDDDYEEVNDASTPSCLNILDMLAEFEARSSDGGVKWNIAALIEYLDSLDSGHIPIEGDIQGNDAVVSGDADVEEAAVDVLPVSAKEKAVDIFETIDVALTTQASWPFVDDEDYDEAVYFGPYASSAFAKADCSDMNHNKYSNGKWDLAALREYANSRDGNGTNASSTIVSKGILAPVKVCLSSFDGSPGASTGQKMDRRSVHFSEVVDVCPVPMREESAICHINKEHAERVAAMVESAKAMENGGANQPPPKPSASLNEFTQQHLIPISSSDDSREEDEDSEVSADNNAPRSHRPFDERKPSQVSSSSLKTADKPSKKRAHVSYESDTDHACQPAKKKAKHAPLANNGLLKSPVVVDSKKQMQAMLDEHCTVRFTAGGKHPHVSVRRSSPESATLKRRPLCQQLYKKTVDGGAPSSASAHIRPATFHPGLAHRRAVMHREAERQRQLHSKEKERERIANRQRPLERPGLPPSVSEHLEAMRQKRIAEDAARRGFFRKQYEMVASGDRIRDDRQETSHYSGQLLQKATPLIEQFNGSLPSRRKERPHTSVLRVYESQKPTIDLFLPVVRVYIDGDGDDSEALMTHRLFKNLTVKSFKVARQAGLVEVENERRMFPELPDGDKSCRFKNRIRCMRFKPKDSRPCREPATDNRRLCEWNRRKVARTYDRQIDEDQYVGADADCFLKNVMSVLLHIPHSPFGDIPQSKSDLLRGVKQTVFAKKTKATGYERFLNVTLPLRGKTHHLHELAPPPPQPEPEPEASACAFDFLPGYYDVWTECLPPLPEEEDLEPLPPPPPPPLVGEEEERCSPPDEVQISPPIHV